MVSDKTDIGSERQLLCLLSALAGARRHRLRLGALLAALVAVVCAVTYGQIELNAWNGSFYDRIGRRDFSALWSSIAIFVAIAGALLVLVVAQTWLQEMIKVRLREWLTHDLLDHWLAPKRPYLLTRAGAVGANPDQYVQADARQLVELSATLGFGLLQSALLLASFTGVLWVLSGQVVFEIEQGRPFAIPGYMVWCALTYAAIGSCLAWLVGRPLIRLNAERCGREADLRFALARIHGAAEAIGFRGGEADERRTVDGVVASVTELSGQLANGVARLTWVTSGSGWLGLIVPVMAALPAYSAGNLSLGGLMMVVGAFNQVQSSLRWFVDNVDKIADWRARLLRVASFREILLDLSRNGQDAKQISIERRSRGKVAFQSLDVLLPEGHLVLDGSEAEVRLGERVLIAGCSEEDGAELLRAVAGPGSQGAGGILLPPADEVVFLSPAVSYPEFRPPRRSSPRRVLPCAQANQLTAPQHSGMSGPRHARRPFSVA